MVRHRDNMRYTSIEERPLPKRQAQDVLIDEVIELELPNARTKYPKPLRRIAVWNEEHGICSGTTYKQPNSCCLDDSRAL